MTSITPITAASSPLQELQKAFCLLRLSSDVVIAEYKQIDAVRSGVDREGVQMFRMAPGKLLLRRELVGYTMSATTVATQ